MALKGFILPDSYSRIERLDFSKQLKYCTYTIVTYENDKLERAICSITSTISGHVVPMYAKYTITDDADFTAKIAEDPVLIKISNPTVETAKFYNNSVVSLVNGAIAKYAPLFVLSEKEDILYKLQPDSTYKIKSGIIETSTEFTKLFADTTKDKTITVYEYLKTLPEYKNCTDC